MSQNVCKQITGDPENALGPCTTQEMAAACVGIMRMMPAEGFQLIVEEAAEDDEILDGLLSALENAQ